MDYKEKYIYISTHRDLSEWLRDHLERAGAYVQNTVTSYTTYIIEPRQNVIKTDDRTCENCQQVNEWASEHDVPYFPLEIVASDLLDITFNPTWVCNSPDVVTSGRRSSQVLISKDGDYQTGYDQLIQSAVAYGLKPKNRYKRGINYIVVPKNLTSKNIEWMRTVLKKANSDSLYLIREDIFLKIMNGPKQYSKPPYSTHYNNQRGEVNQQVFRETRVSKDTELRKAIVEEMKTALRRCEKKFPEEFVVLDTEYKRFPDRPFENLITEVGIIHVKNGNIVEEFDTLVQSGAIDPRSQSKYRDDTTTDIMNVRKLKKEVERIVGDLPIVGHGIRKDIYLLGRAFSKAFTNSFIDTQDLAKRYYRNVPSYKLADLADHFAFNTVKHRALGDCETTLQLYNQIKDHCAQV